MSESEESIYERVARLEDEIATMRTEMDVLKSVLRNKIIRHEHKMIKKGTDVASIID